MNPRPARGPAKAATAGTTAVVALLPDAEPLLRSAAGTDGQAVRPGLPAHATLLYPWLPAGEVDESELHRLRLALPVGPVRLGLASVERTGGFVGVPVPELSPLADAVRTAFPAQVPYGGRFGPRPPVHLTVALDADPRAAADIARRTAAALPITTEINTLHVVGLAPTGWQGLAELPLSH
ncbi:2'-5' RNA ligase family protein [Streptomyces violaceorubidus]|uniref:2'-5' RNA ligase family protein n=1 Tax=Streptomyces violaceorubidus TaxID=284042 RepID=UPI000B269792|nr:2'-5' RNA ligase family protein [Streptomyces violaceorubidus]